MDNQLNNKKNKKPQQLNTQRIKMSRYIDLRLKWVDTHFLFGATTNEWYILHIKELESIKHQDD